MINIAVGKPYPLPINASTDEGGAAVQFLTKSGNTLQIVLPGMNKSEEQALKKGKMKAGFLYKNGDMLWLFRLYDRKNKPLLTLDAPFDIRILPLEQQALHSITNDQQRLVIDVHGIDENRIVRTLRAITLPNELTILFLSSVQKQLTSNKHNVAMPFWIKQHPESLTKKTKMFTLGL